MLIAGAVCPHPPLLIPAALGSAASDPPAELRKVGGGAAEREYDADASGGLHAFGVDVTVGPGEPVLPLSLTVGRWLLERAGILARGEGGISGEAMNLPGGGAGAGIAVVFHEVAGNAAAGTCLKLGRILADAAPRIALL